MDLARQAIQRSSAARWLYCVSLQRFLSHDTSGQVRQRTQMYML